MKHPLITLLVLGLASSGFAQPLTAERVDELRTEIRRNFFVPDPLPALEARTHHHFNPAPGVKAEAVTYATEFGTRVPAILYLPDPLPAGKIPAFIVVNGHGADKYSWYSYYTGVAFARGGMAVLTYDQAGEGERSTTRTTGTREHDRLQGGPVMARRLCGLMLTDVMQAVSYLRSRPEVDPARIGAGGYSLGSFVLSIAGAVEPRLHVCVMVGGGNLDGPGGYWDRSNKQMCQGFPYQSLMFLGDRPAIVYALHAARGPALVWNGRGDNVVNVTHTQDAFFDDLRARVAKLHGSSDGILDYGFTPVGSHRPYWLTRGPVLWLEQHLGFPKWSGADVRALPDVHISEWSKRENFPIDRLYATEEREGGTEAIGPEVPGISREQLSIFTPEQWQREKKDLMFSVWAERARAAGDK